MNKKSVLTAVRSQRRHITKFGLLLTLKYLPSRTIHYNLPNLRLSLGLSRKTRKSIYVILQIEILLGIIFPTSYNIIEI